MFTLIVLDEASCAQNLISTFFFDHFSSKQIL